MADSKINNYTLLSVCIYISFAVAITQVISFLIQKYFLENSDPLSAFIMFIFIVLVFGVLIFILVLAFKPFRNFLLKMYGAYNSTN